MVEHHDYFNNKSLFYSTLNFFNSGSRLVRVCAMDLDVLTFRCYLWHSVTMLFESFLATHDFVLRPFPQWIIHRAYDMISGC